MNQPFLRSIWRRTHCGWQCQAFNICISACLAASQLEVMLLEEGNKVWWMKEAQGGLGTPVPVTYRLPDLYSCTEVHIHPAQSSLLPLIRHLTNVERAPWKLKCGFFSTLVNSETWNFSTPTRETAGLEPRLASLSCSCVHIKYDQSASCSVAMASLTRDELYTPGNCLVSSTLYSLKLRFVMAVYCSSRKETNTLDLKKSPGLAQR